MARALYSLFWWLATPLIALRLFWRARSQPAYLRHLPERWGFYGQKVRGPVIWLHAVSVGETRAAEPLIRAIAEAWPGHRLLLTCMTPTGRDAGQSLFGDTVIQAYLPYDYPGAVGRFLDHFSPCCGLLMETELWPNLLAAAKARQLPVALVNARLSARSARGYRRLAALIRPALGALASVGAQTHADAERLNALGAMQVTVTGNLKFDVVPPEDKRLLGEAWRASLAGRPVCLAASTREGEELLILGAWRAAMENVSAASSPSPLLVIVPRHPQRFDSVAQCVSTQGLRLLRRSQGLPDAHCEVWLGDSMGEMAAYYAMADVAFIGGSLLPLGGQNLIEAAACACPVLIGPHTFNFQQATQDAIEAGAATRVADAGQLIAQFRCLLEQPVALAEMRAAAQAFAQSHRGATARTLDLLKPFVGK